MPKPPPAPRETRGIENVLTRLRQGENRFVQLADNIPESFWLIDIAARRVVYANPAYATHWGGSVEDLYRNRFDWLRFIHPDDLDRMREAVRRNPRGGVNEVVRIVHPNGGQRWLHIRSFDMKDEQGNAHSVGGVGTDITDLVLQREALRASEAVQKGVLDALPAHIAILDAEGVIVAVNEPWSRFAAENSHDPSSAGVGCNYIRVCERSWGESAEEAQDIAVGIRAVIDGLQHEFSLVYACHSPTEKRWFRVLVTPLEARGNRGAVVMHLNVTETVEAQQRLTHLAHFDSLTGLPNRLLFRERLKAALAMVQRQGGRLAVMFIDLDRFKVVNDTLGHLAGDALLQQVAARIGGCLRASDTVGRLGGDEFAVLVPDPEREYDVTVVARRLVDTLAQPITLEGQELFVSASIGITLYPDDCDDLEKLIRNADTAMYRAKELGRNNFQFFTAAMNARVKEQLQLETDLRRAVQRQEFILHFQPKVSCSHGGITGFEALLRWQHPVRGLVSPMEFIPLLEETGLIVPVGTWVLQQACQQAAAWHLAGHGQLTVAVNLSARQLQSEALVQDVRQALEDSGLPPQALELELTESLLMSHVEDNIALLNRLKAMGVQLSVDDFGTGYSSLAYLKRLPLDTVKVDRAFVQDITADPGDASITRAVITMAHNLRLKVVAEGVETEGQIALLVANHCDEMQGYYFSRPVPAPEALVLLDKGRVLPGRLRARGAQVPTVLLVLTAPALRLTLGRALEEANLRVLLAGGGEEGLAALACQRVDAIVADAGLTDSAGQAFLERAGQLQPEAGFLLLSSADNMAAAAAELPPHLAGHLLSRDVGTEVLVAGVLEALRQHSLLLENQRLTQEVHSAGLELSRLGQELESLLASHARQEIRPQQATGIAHEVLQELPAAVLGVDASGMVAYANAAAERLWPACGLIGNESADLLPPELLALLQAGGGSREITLNQGGRCRALCQPFGNDAKTRGHLLLLLPL